MDFDLFGLGVVDDARPRLFLRRFGSWSECFEHHTVGIFEFLRSVMRVRVLEDQEESGLDLPVHGEEAYA